MRAGAMLRKFIYLDETTLAGYTATLEGGLIAQTRTRSKTSGAKGGAIKLKFAEGKLAGANENENEWTMSDEPEARFERLLIAADDDPAAIGWTEVMDPNADFSQAQIGEFVSWECDAYIPDVSQMVSKSGDIAKKLVLAGGMIDAFESGALGDVENATPEAVADMQAKLQLLQGLIGSADIKRSIVGEDADTNWKVFGILHDEHLRDTIDDERLVVVGKIKRKLANDHWRRIAADLVDFKTVNRAERKRRERQAPPEGKENEYIAGPALELDILAINR